MCNGISALSTGIGCLRADAVVTVESDGFRHEYVRVRVDIPPRAAVSQVIDVSAACSNNNIEKLYAV